MNVNKPTYRGVPGPKLLGGWIERLVIFMQTFRYLYKRVNSTEDRKTDIFQTPNEMG